MATQEEIRAGIGEIEAVVKQMAELPQYRRYVEQRKLHLIDGKLIVADKLLEMGLIHV